MWNWEVRSTFHNSYMQYFQQNPPKKKSVVNLINTINNKFSRKSTAIPSHWVKNEIPDLKRQI